MQQMGELPWRRSKRTGEVQVFQGGQWVPQPSAVPTAPQEAPVSPVTLGTPRPKMPAPQRPVEAARDEVGLQRDRLGLEKDRVELEKIRAGTDAKKAGVEQGKAAGFYSRATRSNAAFNSLGIGPPPLAREGAQAVLPEGVVNTFTDPARQQAEAAQKDFIAATLRYESGAAIPPEELETQRRIFFPVAGDRKETVELKAKLRENVLEALRLGAGDAAPDVSAIADETVRHQLEQRIARGDSPQDTIKWLAAIGRPPTEDQVDRIFANAGNTDPRVMPPQEDSSDAHLRSLGVGARGVAQGVGDVMNLASSPFIHGVNAVTGSNYNPDMGEAIPDALGLPEARNNTERVVQAANRGGTAGLTFAGAARGAARYATGAVQNALTRFGSAPLTDAAAGASGMTSGELARQAGASPVVQGAATLAGGAAALPAASRVNALMNRQPPVSTALTRAGSEEGVAVNRAMADPNAQQRVTAVGKTMVGGRMMQRDNRKVGEQIEGRVRQLGRNGQPLEPSVAGQTVERAAERAIETTGKDAKRLYDRAEKASGGVKVPPRNSNTIIDEMLTKLSETAETNKAEITFLQGLKKDFGKDLSVGALRDIRTTLRKKISKGELTFGQNEKRVLDIMDAAADDIANGLANSGKRGAAAMFRRADKMYAERMDFIKGTLQKVVGGRNAHFPPEKIIANLKAMASPKGDAAGLGKTMRSMDPDEQADIAATLAEALGKNPDGEFSTAFLVKHLQKLPRAARVNVFGPQGARSLDNLETLAREHKRVSHALGGSPTGVANDYRSALLNLVFGGGTWIGTGSGAKGLAVAAGGLAVKAGRDVMNARLLMSTDIQGWLQSAPRTQSPGAINQHFDRLKAIATRHPALAPEIEQLQQSMMRAANENTMRGAAASEDGSEER